MTFGKALFAAGALLFGSISLAATDRPARTTFRHAVLSLSPRAAGNGFTPRFAAAPPVVRGSR